MNQSMPNKPNDKPSTSPLREVLYTVTEVAEMWKFSNDYVRNLFKNEPGVRVMGRPHTRLKRGYLTLRIPESVLNRVERRLTIIR
jgi:hypothetical protein